MIACESSVNQRKSPKHEAGQRDAHIAGAAGQSAGIRSRRTYHHVQRQEVFLSRVRLRLGTIPDELQEQSTVRINMAQGHRT
jgi:hypothetical protein